MAFGLDVSDYDSQVGTYGNIIKLDIGDDLPYEIVWVKGEDTSGVKSSAVTTGVSLETLYGYMESSSCPDLAWSMNGQELTIFFKHSVYDTRFAYAAKRHPKGLTATTDTMDLEEDLLPLYRLYVMRSIQNLKGYNGKVLTTEIATEESNYTS